MLTKADGKRLNERMEADGPIIQKTNTTQFRLHRSRIVYVVSRPCLVCCKKNCSFPSWRWYTVKLWRKRKIAEMTGPRHVATSHATDELICRRMQPIVLDPHFTDLAHYAWLYKQEVSRLALSPYYTVLLN